MKTSDVKKELINQIYKNLHSIDGVISITLVGSFIDKDDLSGISDIDTVVICEKLDEHIFDKCVKSTENIDLVKCGLAEFSLRINSTFGPLKFDDKDTVIIHLMVYDVASHIKHVISSPFTCFDWERSKNKIGLSLKDIYPVGVLQYRDFTGARRSLKNYIDDLNKNQISYREYSFNNQDISEIKKFKPLDDRHKGEYAYHIIKNLIINYNKFIKIENSSLTDHEILKKATYFFDSNKNIKELKRIIELKSNRAKKFPSNSIYLAKSFINNFQKLISEDWENTTSIHFIRHFETIYNDGSFLGQKRDPDIKNVDHNIILKDIDEIFSSPMLRCIQTAKSIFNNKKINIDNRLTEIDYGLAEGLKYDELCLEFPEIVNAWENKQDINFPKGESTVDVNSRLSSFLNYLVKKIKSKNIKNVCILTHNVVLRCLIGSFYNIEQYNWHKLIIPHGTVFQFKLKNGKLYPNIDRNILYKMISNVGFEVK